MRNASLTLTLAFVLMLTACTTFFRAIPTLTGIVDDASKEYAAAYRAGLVPADVATKASLAHLEYRKAAGIAADALTAYKLGQTADVKGALEAARMAASHFIEAIAGLLTKDRAMSLRAQVGKADAP